MLTTNSSVHDAVDITHPGGMRGNRVFPTAIREHLDPFVVFERFYIQPDQGFETHPHRGFEIVSYMLEGGMAHDDSLGNSYVARAGDAMRVTAGSGIRHSELPADGAACTGLQLWVNLPQELKDIDPGYEDVRGERLPTEDQDGAAVTTVVGAGSPLDLHTPVTYHDIRVRDGWTWSLPADWVGFLYGIDGRGTVDGVPMHDGQFHLVTERQSVTVESETGLRMAAVAGQPHGQPIHQRGPFVD